MADILALAATNLTSPLVLFFALGVAAAVARSDLAFPEAAAKALSLYLLFAIGFKGGASVADHGLDAALLSTLFASIVLSAALPFIAFGLLRVMSGLSRTDAAAVSAHYGSISIVTFVAASAVLDGSGIPYEGYMVAAAAAMESPAILAALYLASTGAPKADQDPADRAELIREIALNGSIVLLVGSFAIGWITGTDGLKEIESFVVSPFKGVLCLFLLDMGLLAGRGLKRSLGELSATTIAFGIVMPLVGSVIGAATALLLGLSAGGATLMITLCASASYIAAPAAMRVALPDANPSIYLTLSLGVTFPFNLTLGIPLYVALGRLVGGS